MEVTSAVGGKISGPLALTFEASEALAKDDPVHVTGDYVVEKADGSKPIVGFVDVPNVTRSGATYPAARVPGTCTVEARGVSVRKLTSGAAVTAGARVGINNAGKVVAAPAIGVAECGISLTGAGAVNVPVDVLITSSVHVGA